jgi:hypothetical protein
MDSWTLFQVYLPTSILKRVKSIHTYVCNGLMIFRVFIFFTIFQDQKLYENFSDEKKIRKIGTR